MGLCIGGFLLAVAALLARMFAAQRHRRMSGEHAPWLTDRPVRTGVAAILARWALVVVLVALAMIVLASRAAHAQTPPPIAPRPVQDPAQTLIDQQRERARQRALEQRPAQITVAPQTPETTLDIPADTPVDQIAEPGPTFRVERIVLSGPQGAPLMRTAISPAKLDAITAPFVGRDLGSHRINVLLKRITEAYVAAGYVTTRALLGPQNIGSGTLSVTVLIGTIQSFMVNGKPVHRLATNEASSGGGWLTDAGYESAFPAKPGDPLRLSDIDQGVAQINRLRRNQAQIQVLPGSTPGGSVIDIVNPPADRLYYTFGVDNYGAAST